MKINSISEIKFKIENRKRRNRQFSVSVELENKMILSVHGLKCKCKFHNLFFQFEKGNQNWKTFAALFGKKNLFHKIFWESIRFWGHNCYGHLPHNTFCCYWLFFPSKAYKDIRHLLENVLQSQETTWTDRENQWFMAREQNSKEIIYFLYKPV